MGEENYIRVAILNGSTNSLNSASNEQLFVKYLWLNCPLTNLVTGVICYDLGDAPDNVFPFSVAGVQATPIAYGDRSFFYCRGSA